MYVTWGQIAHNEGSWIRSYGPGQMRATFGAVGQGGQNRNLGFPPPVNPGYETLIEPDGPIIFAGDHVSHLVAWQEGAALSALRAVGQVGDRVKAARVSRS